MARTSGDIRSVLSDLGERRLAHEREAGVLAADVEAALRRAYSDVPVAEAARLLHMHRTTVYRVYHPHAA